MTKSRFNLRKVAIAICLAGITMFVSCNKEQEPKPSLAEEQKEAVLAVLGTNSALSKFVEALKNLDLSDIDAAELTVFAVQNGGITRSELKSSSNDDFEIKRHVVVGKHPESSLTDGKKLTALDGSELTFSVTRGNIFVNGVELGEEIMAGNSVVFVVNKPIPATPPESTMQMHEDMALLPLLHTLKNPTGGPVGSITSTNWGAAVTELGYANLTALKNAVMNLISTQKNVTIKDITLPDGSAITSATPISQVATHPSIIRAHWEVKISEIKQMHEDMAILPLLHTLKNPTGGPVGSITSTNWGAAVTELGYSNLTELKNAVMNLISMQKNVTIKDITLPDGSAITSATPISQVATHPSMIRAHWEIVIISGNEVMALMPLLHTLKNPTGGPGGSITSTTWGAAVTELGYANLTALKNAVMNLISIQKGVTVTDIKQIGAISEIDITASTPISQVATHPTMIRAYW